MSVLRTAGPPWMRCRRGPYHPRERRRVTTVSTGVTGEGGGSGVLSPYRVLDLTDERGQLAGLILAQLGAEVIAVEPPGGARSRAMGPFVGDVVDPERSLQHAAYNRGKRSVVLDLAGSEEDRDAFCRLVAGADVVIDSSAPGELGALGLGHDDLAALNPALVHASITAFGQDGPKAGWAACDLTVWAAAGPLKGTGDADRAPMSMPGGQAFVHGAAEAAGAIIAALYERGRSGRGQHVDVSAQLAAAPGHPVGRHRHRQQRHGRLP